MSSPVRVEVIGDAQRTALTELIDSDPVVNSVISARVRALRSVEPHVFGGPLLGAWSDTGSGPVLRGAAFRGGNVLPIGGSDAEWHALATGIARTPRHCSSIVGRADAVHAYWAVLSRSWGPARAIRARQPLLMVDRTTPPPLAGDPRVRAMRPEELDIYLPAAVDMFTAELGVSPVGGGEGEYRRRLLGLIREGRALGVVDAAGSVVFKADIGAVSPHACQVQGVWVRPDLRGRGIGTAALASVLNHALTLAPAVSLYVNDYNVAALRMYERLGMRHLADLSTILF